MVEAEYVVAYVDGPGEVWAVSTADFDTRQPIPSGLDYAPSEQPGVERHYRIDIPKTGPIPPISLAELSKRSAALQPAMWALFWKPNVWAYRPIVLFKSNLRHALETGQLTARLRRECKTLNAIVDGLESAARCSIAVEQAGGSNRTSGRAGSPFRTHPDGNGEGGPRGGQPRCDRPQHAGLRRRSDRGVEPRVADAAREPQSRSRHRPGSRLRAARPAGGRTARR
jgi:hypothetical protein